MDSRKVMTMSEWQMKIGNRSLKSEEWERKTGKCRDRLLFVVYRSMYLLNVLYNKNFAPSEQLNFLGKKIGK